MPALFVYKMTADEGGAPCVFDRKLSLAICKPAIRTGAQPGDVVLGFAGNNLYPSTSNCLVYAAEITRALTGALYYSSENRLRPDCIYRLTDGVYKLRRGAKFHRRFEDLEHDLGKPPYYRRARVLLSDDPSKFRYYGSSCRIPYQSKYPALAQFVRALTQGHRKNLDKAIEAQIRSLLKDVFRTPKTPGNTPVPQKSSQRSCSPDDGYSTCRC